MEKKTFGHVHTNLGAILQSSGKRRVAMDIMYLCVIPINKKAVWVMDSMDTAISLMHLLSPLVVSTQYEAIDNVKRSVPFSGRILA